MEKAKVSVVAFTTQDIITTSGETKGYYASANTLKIISGFTPENYGARGDDYATVLYNGVNYGVFVNGILWEPDNAYCLIQGAEMNFYSPFNSPTAMLNISTIYDDNYNGYTEITDGSMMQDVLEWLDRQGKVLALG